MVKPRIITPNKFLKGLLILLLAPIAVLVLLAAYVYWTNSRPQAGRLQTRVAPQVVLPGREAAYFMTFTGEEKIDTAKPAEIDVAFLIDVSGSMTTSLPAMSDAAYKVAGQLAAEKGRIRFALIRFDTEAEITTPWTDDPDVLLSGLRRLESFTGQNDTRAAFTRLSELFKSSRPGAKKAVVFYTDGLLDFCNSSLPGTPCPDGPMSEQEMIDKAAELRGEGFELFSIGLPGSGSAPLMGEITDSPSRVFDPVDLEDLAANFRKAVDGVIGDGEEGGQLINRIDGRHFSVPLQGTSWGVDRTGALTLSVGKLPATATSYAHPLVPLSAGLWRVGVDAPRLTFAAANGRLMNLRAEHRPAVLVLTWMTLFWLFLPMLLWTLVYLLQPRPQDPQPVTPQPEISRPRPPSLLPALPHPTSERLAPVPSLFIGLGGAGRRSLEATRAELKQAHVGEPSPPYKFLWLDLDTKEAEKKTVFDDWSEFPIEPVIAPPEIRHVYSYRPEPGNLPEYLRWFEAQDYLNVPRETLNLSEGTRGDRSLGRLALFQWLSQTENGLLEILERDCAELAKIHSPDGTRQIVVFASPDGGTGSSWFIDVGRLLKRLTRTQQKQGDIEFTPEVIGVLSTTPLGQNAPSRHALEVEFGSASLAGAFPQRNTYGQEHRLLDLLDQESPYGWVFTVSAYDDDSVAAQAAELAAIAVERYPRSSLLKTTDPLHPVRFTSARTKAIHVLPVQLSERIEAEVFLRTLGPEVLLDLDASLDGGFELKPINDDRANSLLREWTRTEPAGTPLQLLLMSASDSSLTQGFLRVMKEGTPPTKQWFLQSFIGAVNLRLHGHRDSDGSEWNRGWMPGEAIAILQLLAVRLENVVVAEMSAMGLSPTAIEGVDCVRKVAVSAVTQLKTWTAELCTACRESYKKHLDSTRRPQELQRLSDRTYLDPLPDPKSVDRWIKEIFESWLHTPNATAAIRERLLFTFIPEEESVRLVIRSYVDRMQEYSTAQSAVGALQAQARALATLAPAVRIGGALAKEPQPRRVQLAEELVDGSGAPDEVLVVAPESDDPAETRAVTDFCKSVSQPLGHGSRCDEFGDDQTALRRLELRGTNLASVAPAARTVFVTLAEQEAELLRLRAEKKHNVEVATFPSELRVALSHPAAFTSFVLAYKAGHIGLHKDAAGADQWSFVDTGEFLTSSAEPTLAQAAATYSWYVTDHPTAFEQIGNGGSFTKLNHWKQSRGVADDDTLTLIAIDIYQD
jgi:hypothetical protein